jgi:hypothetical protein
MTEQYYSKEEQPVESNETAIENWTATTNALDGVVVDTADKINRSEEILSWAETVVGDEGVPFIQEARAITIELGTRITQYDAARLQAGVFMKEMADRHHRLAGDYEELQNAVVDIDRTHPLVDRMVETIEEEVAEQIYEDSHENEYDAALEEAYENVFQELHDGLHEATGTKD